jgi:hypothetical protein
MIPSNHTLETITRARIADRVAEAAQRHLERAVGRGGRRPMQTHATSADTLSWLRQLATRLTGAGA